MRDTPVNFDGADIVTTIRSKLLLRPWYLAKANDPREGLRMAVEDVSGPRRLIERDCSEAEVARNGRYIAIACAVEQVGERPLYRTSVYRARDLRASAASNAVTDRNSSQSGSWNAPLNRSARKDT